MEWQWRWQWQCGERAEVESKLGTTSATGGECSRYQSAVISYRGPEYYHRRCLPVYTKEVYIRIRTTPVSIQL